MRMLFFGLTFIFYETGLSTFSGNFFSYFRYMEEMFAETSDRMGHFAMLRMKRLFLIVNITPQKNHKLLLSNFVHD